jgi:fucose 4-O-acetylase-like acetyltransferase
MGMIMEPRRYNQTADTLKGLLIVLVILGHFLLGTLMDNPIRYFIYSFHMPLFLFVGGYLINLPKLADMSWKDIFVKHFKRMLMAWGIAWGIYTLWACYPEFSSRQICF